jgi:hypothetical protein
MILFAFKCKGIKMSQIEGIKMPIAYHPTQSASLFPPRQLAILQINKTL